MKLSLALKVIGLEAKKLMSYRADFWLKSLVSLFAILFLQYFFWMAIFEASGQKVISGYNFPQMISYYFFVIIVRRLVSGDDFGGAIAQEIYDGSLNRYILYPTNHLVFKYSQHLGSHFPILIQVSTFLLLLPFIVDFGNLPSFTVERVLAIITFLFLANLMQFLILYAVEAIAFWADQVWSLVVMMRFATRLLGGAMIPLELFPDLFRTILEFLPFKFLYYMPVALILGKIPLEGLHFEFLLAIVWIGFFLLVAKTVWKKGNHTYTGVGI